MYKDFGGRASWGTVIPEKNATQADVRGHGTHVAGAIGGTLNGVAGGYALIAVKVGNDNGDYNDEDIYAGMSWAINHVRATQMGHKAVINLCIKLRNDPTLNRLIARAEEVGMLFVKSAGNEAVSIRIKMGVE